MSRGKRRQFTAACLFTRIMWFVLGGRLVIPSLNGAGGYALIL